MPRRRKYDVFTKCVPNCKALFPKDFESSLYADRIESTAHCCELVSCLYSAYPDEARTEDDLTRALALLAMHDNIYAAHELAQKGYHVGAFVCVLLDCLEDDWQTRLAANAELTPMGMLRDHFAGETLPDPQQFTQTKIDAVDKEIGAFLSKKCHSRTN